jgi:hypothetical protein
LHIDHAARPKIAADYGGEMQQTVIRFFQMKKADWCGIQFS